MVYLLFFIHIILVVVVFLPLVLIVGLSVFMVVFSSLIPAGTLVMLYQCTHYTSRGGRSGHGSNCGSFSVNTNDIVSGTLWGLGAALLRVHIIFFVVVLLTMVPIVGHSLFMHTLLLIMELGVMVLLYHLNLLVHIILLVVTILIMVIFVEFFVFILVLVIHLLLGLLVPLFKYTHYPAHGGASNASARCGVICIIYSAAFTNNSWLYGAALSFIHIHIMLFLVVILIMVPIVVLSLFILPLLLVIPFVLMVLLYHLCKSYYFHL